MTGLMVFLCYTLSFVGAAAHSLFWIEFSVPYLNAAWLVSLPIAGVAAEMTRARREFSKFEEIARVLHAALCSFLAMYTVTWPAVVMAATGDFIPRPLTSPLVCLLCVGPFYGACLRGGCRGSWPLRAVAAAGWVVAVLPTLGVLALMGFGAVFFLGDRIETTDLVPSPDGAMAARHEYRVSGGVFADACGGIWVESKWLPIRRQVYRFACDGPLPEFKWIGRRLRVRPPKDGVGRKVGRPSLF